MTFIKTMITGAMALFLVAGAVAQEAEVNKDSLQARIGELQGEVKKLEAEINKTKGLIPPTYGWKTGFGVTLGFNSTYLDNWQLNPNANSTTQMIMGSFNGFANYIQEKSFWRNNAIVSLGYQRQTLDRNDPDSPRNLEPTVDVLQVTSLYGRKINDKIAYSALGELRATLLENRFNPGYIDAGVGITYTPLPNLVAVFHPLNYNIVIAEEALGFESSLGTKIVVDYTQQIIKGVRLRSNLSGFASYENFSDLSNFTWTSGINFTAFKGVGVGIEYALRWAPQETRMVQSESGNIQNFLLIGLSYSL